MAATLTRPTVREAFVRSALRECARLRADPWDLALATWVPLLALALLAWMFSAGVPRELPVAVVDHDNSAASRLRTDGSRRSSTYTDASTCCSGARNGDIGEPEMGNHPACTYASQRRSEVERRNIKP